MYLHECLYYLWNANLKETATYDIISSFSLNRLEDLNWDMYICLQTRYKNLVCPYVFGFQLKAHLSDIFDF